MYIAPATPFGELPAHALAVAMNAQLVALKATAAAAVAPANAARAARIAEETAWANLNPNHKSEANRPGGPFNPVSPQFPAAVVAQNDADYAVQKKGAELSILLGDLAAAAFASAVQSMGPLPVRCRLFISVEGGEPRPLG